MSSGLQVAPYRNKTVPKLMRLQTTARSRITPTGATGTIAIRPPPTALLQDGRALREPGVTTCVRGIIGNMKELVFSQDDGSFKTRTPIGEIGCCESAMAERTDGPKGD